MAQRYDVYLSYASQDEPWARAIAEELACDGCTVFPPGDGVNPGESFVRMIDAAMEASDILIAIISPRYSRSLWAIGEVSSFTGRGKPILPVRVRHTEIPAALRDYQLLDLTGFPPDTDFAREVRHAYEALRDRSTGEDAGTNTGRGARADAGHGVDGADSASPTRVTDDAEGRETSGRRPTGTDIGRLAGEDAGEDTGDADSTHSFRSAVEPAVVNAGVVVGGGNLTSAVATVGERGWEGPIGQVRIAILHTEEDAGLARSLDWAFASSHVTGRSPVPVTASSFRLLRTVDVETGEAVFGFVRSPKSSDSPFRPDDETNIADAGIVLVLVRRALLSSGFADSSIMRWLLDRDRTGRTVVLPVVTAPVSIDNLPLGDRPWLPTDGRPVSEWESLDAAITNVVDGVRLTVEELVERQAAGRTLRGHPDAAARPVLSPGQTSGQPQRPRHTRGGVLGRDVPGLSERPRSDDSDAAAITSRIPRTRGGPSSWTPPEQRTEQHTQRRTHELNEVFTRNGVPLLTFVEPPDYFRFVMALRAPGRGIVLEGPSGIGKTTLLKKALERAGMTDVRQLSARKATDRRAIEGLLTGDHGIVAIDDFHRLPARMRARLLDHLKVLADEESDAKLIVVGIPGTGASLIELGFDVATRIDVFRLPKVDDRRVLEVVEKGERALNVSFDDSAQIVRAAAGSLLTAQMLCWELAVLAGVERTQPFLLSIAGDVSRAEIAVMRSLADKYDRELGMFAALDGPRDATCVHLLTELGKRPDGILHLDELREQARRTGRTEFASGIEAFVGERPGGLTGPAAAIEQHLHYDPHTRMMVGEDPQLLFYLRRRTAEQLAAVAGKRLPRPRDQIFVSYSHRDGAWLDRLDTHLRPLIHDKVLDVWDDRRLQAGDRWQDEIASALDRAKMAILLVSADYLASDFINRREIPPLLAAAGRGGCRIVPVIVGSCLFADDPRLSVFQSINPSDQPLDALPRHEAEGYLAAVARTFLHA